jgi:large subunit ribosomal protein L33
MAGKGHRVTVKLKSTESAYMYSVKKNKQNTTERLELKKYDPIVRKHVVFKESRERIGGGAAAPVLVR